MRRYSGEGRPETAVHVRDLSTHHAADKDVGRGPHRTRERKDLVPLRVSPPAPAYRTAGDKFRKNWHGSSCTFEHNAVLAHKRERAPCRQWLCLRNHRLPSGVKRTTASHGRGSSRTKLAGVTQWRWSRDERQAARGSLASSPRCSYRGPPSSAGESTSRRALEPCGVCAPSGEPQSLTRPCSGETEGRPSPSGSP